jgi:hypothetical protein
MAATAESKAKGTSIVDANSSTRPNILGAPLLALADQFW